MVSQQIKDDIAQEIIKNVNDFNNNLTGSKVQQ